MPTCACRVEKHTQRGAKPGGVRFIGQRSALHMHVFYLKLFFLSFIQKQSIIIHKQALPDSPFTACHSTWDGEC